MKSQFVRSGLAQQSSGTRGVIRKWLILVTIALMTLPSTRWVNAQGIFYSVNTTSDTVVIGACQNGNPGCSLRGAIQVANSHPGADGIGIGLPAGSVINLTGVLPDLTEGVSISGPGANLVTVRRNTGGNYRIFNVFTTGAVTLSGLTISNGFSSNGGGIANAAGTVNVTNCVLSGNAALDGGGISNYSSGTANVTNSTISGNTATGSGGNGGGIENRNTGTVNVTNSTLSGNSTTGNGGNGGGVFNGGSGSVEVINSTLSGNSTTGNGGGISNSGTFFIVFNSTLFSNVAAIDGGGINNTSAGILDVANSTLSGNSAGASGEGHGGGAILTAGVGEVNVTHSTLSSNSTNGGGGGIGNNGSTVTVKSCIIALNTGSNSIPDVSGIFTSDGFNLIGRRDGSAGFGAPSDQTGTVALPLDPKLDPAGLQNNGGPTQTIALLFGSPAIDKGTNTSRGGTLTTDQRGTGFPRTFDYPSITNARDGTDVGAFELLVPFSVSRKTHGAAMFDIDLPLTGALGIECRKGGASRTFKVIVTFPSAVTVGNASVTLDPNAPGATGSVSGFSVKGSRVIVNLTAVSNAQTIVVKLSGVSDGTNTNDVSVPMGVLLGDTTGNGAVKSGDVTLTQSKAGQTVDASNFREDVTIDGSIDRKDINLVVSKKGTALP